MTDKPIEEKSHAERFASFLEQMEQMFPNPQAAAELRRLHEVNQAYVELVDALTDTLMEVSLSYPKAKINAAHKTRINAALAKAKEST